MREPATDHDGLQVDVEPRSDQGLVAAGHHNQLIDELVVGASPAADFFAQRAFLRLGHRLHDEHLEVRLVTLHHRLVLQLARVGGELVALLEARVLDIASAVRLRRQCAVDPRYRVRELVVTTRREQPRHAGELRCAGYAQYGSSGVSVASRSLQIATYSSLSSPLVVGFVSRSAASSNRHQASPRSCQTLL